MTKPTKAAIRVNDLLETITGETSYGVLVQQPPPDETSADRYRPLASFSQKLRFLIDIQIAIFDKFHHRLNSGLEAYLAATSTVIRAVQGVSKEDIAGVQGVSGLERLCRVYGSAEYLEKAMADWSDDIVRPVFRFPWLFNLLIMGRLVLLGTMGRTPGAGSTEHGQQPGWTDEYGRGRGTDFERRRIRRRDWRTVR